MRDFVGTQLALSYSNLIELTLRKRETARLVDVVGGTVNIFKFVPKDTW